MSVTGKQSVEMEMVSVGDTIVVVKSRIIIESRMCAEREREREREKIVE